jgi:hypothetical protein
MAADLSAHFCALATEEAWQDAMASHSQGLA